GGEFSSDLLWDFCRGEGILQFFTLLASPQQIGVAECCIGLVMEVACTSMIHAAVPHFLWPFAVRALVPLSAILPADKLSSRTIPCVFLGFPPDTPGWQFYHPTLRRVLPSQDVMFDESVPFYRLFPYRTAPLPPAAALSCPRTPPVDPLPPQGPAPSGVSQVDSLLGTVSVEVAVDSGVARGTASGDAASGGAEPASVEPGGAEPAGVEPGGAESKGAEFGGAEHGGAESGDAEPGGAKLGGTEPEGAEPGGAKSEGVESGGAEPRDTASAGGPAGALPPLSPRREPLSPQQLREWFAQRTRLRRGAGGAGGSLAGGTGAGGAGASSPGAAGVTTGARGTGGAGAAGARAGGAGARDTGAGGVGAGDPGAGGEGVGGAGAGGTGAGGTGAGGAGAGDTSAGAGGPGAGDPGAGGAGARGTGAGGARAGDPGDGGAGAGGTGAGGTVQRRPFFVPPLPSSLPPSDSVLCQVLNSPLPVRAVRTGRRVPRPRPPPISGTHIMSLRPSSIPLRVPLVPPPVSSLASSPDPESDLARAASPTVPHLLATVVTDPLFESTAASALVAELVDFASACRLDYATSLVAESESDYPSFVGGECALGTDVLEDRQEDFECLADAVPHLVAMLLAPEGDPDAPDIPTPRSYAEEKLSSLAIPCVFLGFSPDALGWQFYHPTWCRVFPSQDVTFDESVLFYRLFPYHSAPPPPLPLFLAPDVDLGAARGTASGGAASGGAEPGGAEPGGAESEGAGSGGAEPGGGESGGAEPGGAEPRGTASSRGPAGASPRQSPQPEPLSLQQLREWFTQRIRLRSGATGAGHSAAGDTRAGGAGVTTGAGGTEGAAAAGPGGACTRGTGAAGTGSVGGTGAGDSTELGAAEAGGTGAGSTCAGGAGAGGAGAVGAGAGGSGAGGAGAGGAGAVDPGAGGAGAGGAVSGGTSAGGTVRPQPYFVPLLQQVLGVPSSTGLTPPLLSPLPDQSQPLLQPASALPAPSPYTEQAGGLTERREPASRPASPVRTRRCVPCPRPPPVPGTHAMALRPSSVPLHVPLPPSP
ncbi:unnamed protein product, partial [Closterium sp. NIES-53]